MMTAVNFTSRPANHIQGKSYKSCDLKGLSCGRNEHKLKGAVSHQIEIPSPIAQSEYWLYSEMCSPFGLLGMIVVISVINGDIFASVKASKTDQTKLPAKACDKVPVNNYNCNCNINQDLHVREAIDDIKRKLEQLIALVNRSITPQPPTKPGLRSFY